MPTKCSACGKYHMGFCKQVTMYALTAQGKVTIKSAWDCLGFVWAVWWRNRKSPKGTIIDWRVFCTTEPIESEEKAC